MVQSCLTQVAAAYACSAHMHVVASCHDAAAELPSCSFAGVQKLVSLYVSKSTSDLGRVQLPVCPAVLAVALIQQHDSGSEASSVARALQTSFKA